MTDRFELEQAILESDMTNDLKIAFERHCDGSVMSQDEVDNMLMGLWQVSQMRQWKLWDTFTRVYQLDDYRASEWVGLTDEDIIDLWKTEYFNVHYQLPKAVEARLKEKNT